MRVRRSFGFVDLCGFTSLTDAHGDESAVTQLAAFRQCLREVCSRRGVRVAKWLGDGAMLVSVEIGPLVEAVLEIERRIATGTSPLALRAGLTTGDVILFEGDDYIGQPVNLAARLSDMAGPHEVLSTTEVAAAAPPWAAIRPLGRLVVRGLARRVELVALTSRLDDRGGPPRVIDPVCRMEIPADAVVATRMTPDGVVIGFCSESCAETWEGRPGLAPDRGLLA